MRAHTNIFVSILNKDHKEEIRSKLEGIDFAICNPVGPINLKMSLMMRKLSVDTFFRGKEISKGKILERKKQGIFGSSATNASSFRGSRLTHGFAKSGVYGDQSKIVNGEQLFNVLSYRKLIFNLDFDTQIDLNENIVNIINVDAKTGKFMLKVSTVLTKKMESL